MGFGHIFFDAPGDFFDTENHGWQSIHDSVLKVSEHRVV